MKKGLPGYKHAERRLDRAVVEALGLDATEDKKVSAELADEVVGKHELAVYFPDGGYEKPDDLRHDPGAVDPTADDEALFLGRAEALELR